MDGPELRRLIVRHRHVAPMLSVLLAGTDARVTITDIDGQVILDRQVSGGGAGEAPVERHPIVIEGDTVGWVEGPRPAGSIAAVLAYAGARETDKRSLAREALDRYRELNLIYDLADQIGAVLETEAIAQVAVSEASRLPSGGSGFVLLLEADGSRLVARPSAGEPPIVEQAVAHGILGAILSGDPEIVNDIAGDPRATAVERAFASLVAAPLRVRGERIGVIGTISQAPIEFHASDLRLLGAIASLAAPTFDQAAAHAAAMRATGAAR